MNSPASSDAAASTTEAIYYPDHPLAGIFPKMSDFGYSAMAEDIRLHGQRSPITLFESKILDGRSRYRACLLARVTPIIQEYRGKDPLHFVLSANLQCRHLPRVSAPWSPPGLPIWPSAGPPKKMRQLAHFPTNGRPCL